MVERLLCMQEAQGSIPCSSTLFFVQPAFVYDCLLATSTTRATGRERFARRTFIVAANIISTVVGALAQW